MPNKKALKQATKQKAQPATTSSPAKQESPAPFNMDTPAEAISMQDVLQLQRQHGNAYTQTYLQRTSDQDSHGKGCGCVVCGGGRIQRTVDLFANASSGGGRQIQRELMSYTDWIDTSNVSDSGKQMKKRSKKLKKIDTLVQEYHAACGYPATNFGQPQINGLLAAIDTWISSKNWFGSKRMNSITSLKSSAEKEKTEVDEMVQIKERMASSYGISLDNEAGIDSIKKLYTRKKSDVKRLAKLKASRWKLQELRGVDKALALYAPLLGANRDTDKLGKQTIDTFSRLETAANRKNGKSYTEGKDGMGISTFAETFTQTIDGDTMSNISVFDYSDSVDDFAGDPHNPTKEELERGYNGTIVHELSHGLIEMLPAPSGAADYPDGTKVTDMINHFANTIDFWKDTYDESNAKNREQPITDYGDTSAAEDMAESIMFFFEEPGKLQKECPQRYKFITDNLSSYLSKDAFDEATEKARKANPELNPVPPAALNTDGGSPEMGDESKQGDDEVQSGIEEILNAIIHGIDNPQEEKIGVPMDIDYVDDNELEEPANDESKEVIV